MKNNSAMVFVYFGINKQGQKIAGELVSNNMAMAKAQLRQQGIRVESIKRKPKGFFTLAAIGKNNSIKPVDTAIFMRQLATLIKAGVPIINAFDIVADLLDKPSMQQLVLQIKADVQSGTTFAQALAKYPKYFDGLVCSLVESGEQSGTLETMLQRIASYKEKNEKLKSKIKKELTYPLVVVIVAIFVMIILMVRVVPVFAELFASLGSDLPVFTQLVVAVSSWLQRRWWILLLASVIAVWCTIKMYKNHVNFKNKVDVWLLKLPIIGSVVYHAVVARFARTLSTTFTAGVPLIGALNYTAGATGNHKFYVATQQIKEDVKSGINLQTAMQRTAMFPSLAIQLVGVGEQAGSLEDMLDNIADYYEQKVDNALESMTTLLEPMVMVVLGVLVGGLVVAMYLPIFQMGSVVG
ncbi:MAG: type II secretion system protein F [Gammaproteobacteria bacterium]|nr:MAG: type II secretion system protein F [Gammaproteobacteria bacterium]